MPDIRRNIQITPGRSGFEVVVNPYTEGTEHIYVTDMFDLHRTIDRLFPPQKSIMDEFRAEIAAKDPGQKEQDQ